MLSKVLIMQKPAPPKGKGQQSREKIVKVAIELFSRQGYDATSVQQIADQCQLSQTNVFYHFGSKRKLFEHTVHVVIEHNRQIIGKLGATQDPWERMVNFIKGNVLWAHKYSNEFQIIMLLLYFSASENKFKMLASEIFENAVSMLVPMIDQIRAGAQQDGPLTSTDLARIIQQYVNGVQYQVVSRRDGHLIFENFQKNLTQFLKLVLQL